MKIEFQIIALLYAGVLCIPLLILYARVASPNWVLWRVLLPGLAGLLTLFFVVWAVFFIHYVSMFCTLDHNRYYLLHDDAMISMRYAWNLAHGHGLVWNVGEYVEGYTNLLMVLIMAVPTGLLDKNTAVLAMQIFGVGVVLGNAALMGILAGDLCSRFTDQQRRLLQWLAFACGLLYFPLIFWPLAGSEQGVLAFFVLLGLLAAVRFVDTGQPRWLYTMTLVLGLASLTRPDGLIPGVGIAAYVLLSVRRSRRVELWSAAILLFPLGQTLFRLVYYGELVPNTYTLKVVGIPLGDRLRDGLGYMQPFFHDAGWLLIVAGFGLVFAFSRRKLLALSLVGLMILYQIWAGGDISTHYWRLLVPVLPLLLIAFIEAVIRFVYWLTQRRLCRADVRYLAVFGLVGLSLYAINIYYISDDFLETSLMHSGFHWHLVNKSVTINAITTPEATIGVSAAGAIPYFTGRPAVDMLGKVDSYIAHSEPRLGSVSAEGMINYPGHIKYDLTYSILELQPDYIDRVVWGEQNITEHANEIYATLSYKGQIVRVRKGSPYIKWELLEPIEEE